MRHAMSPADGADFRVVNENLRQALGSFAWVKETGEQSPLPGVSVVRANVGFGLFNTAVLSTPVPGEDGDFDLRVARADAYFIRAGLPWSLWYCEDLLDAFTRRRARIILATRGMRSLMEAPGMITYRLLPPARPLPALECRRVTDAPTRAAFGGIMSAAFELPATLANEVYGSERLWRSRLTGYVGFENGVPVTTVATYVAAGAVGVYAVGTPPQRQRRGYAESLMRFALEEERRLTGVERTILQASPAGLNLYLRMGYRTVTRFCVSGKG
jgi:GNAT superfamily N-acetyltransferase